MYLLRPARASDLAAMLELSRHLDSPNLPHDEDFLRARLARSERSFARFGPPDAEGEYQVVLEDETGRVVGTSAVLAKHGTPGMPHVFLKVTIEERRSESLGIRVKHAVLQLGASEDGPTEIGALVLLPDARGGPESPGKLLSWGRFALIARHREAFCGQILAEMRASLDPAGRNAFWDAFGRHFTQLSYAEADRLSAEDKSFITDLFPDTPFYATLLPEDVMNELGCVHPEAAPAMRLLQKAGMFWIGEIDPFDAGPFIGAPTADVLPIRETVWGTLEAEPLEDDADTPRFIAATEEGDGFRAVVTAGSHRDGALRLPKEAARRLGVEEGASLSLTPMPVREPRRG